MLPQTQPKAARPWPAAIYLTVVAWTFAVSAARAVRAPNSFAQAHWLLDYRFGLVKRGWVGSLLTLACKLHLATLSIPTITALAVAIFAVMVGVLHAVIFWIGRRDRWSDESRLAGLVFAGSYYLVMSAHLMGYFDHLIVILTVVALGCAATGRRWWAAVVAAVAVLVHESFLLVGLPSVALAMSGGAAGANGRDRWRRLVPLLLPLGAFGTLVLAPHLTPADLRFRLYDRFHNFGLSDPTFAASASKWLTTSLGTYFQEQVGKLPDRLAFGLRDLGVLLPLLVFLLAIAARTSPRRFLVSLVVTFVPLGMLAVAWDFERIWCFPLFVVLIEWLRQLETRRSGEGLIECRQWLAPLAILSLVVTIFIPIFLMDKEVERLSWLVRLVAYAPAGVLAAWLAVRITLQPRVPVAGGWEWLQAFWTTRRPLPTRRWAALFAGIGGAVFLAAFLWKAWLCDDAYISLRVVQQLFAGHGLRWNPHERVQVFTHPLWLMILAGLHALSTDDYRNVILLSAVCTALTLYVLWRIARRPALWLGAVGLLVASRAFVEFCSSGLENPLSFALTALFFWQLGRWESQARDPQAPHAAFRQLLWLTLGLGLALTNRLDLACLLGPAWLWAVARTYRRHRGATAAIALGGLSPWFGWCAFALVYYGFVLPNTAYAKLPPNLTLWDRIPQGGWYLIDTIEQNPIAIVGLALAIAVALRSRRLRVRATGWGILGYLAYVIWVGGDFMSGRFLTEPFLAAVILLLQSGWVRTVSTFPVRRAVVAGSVGVLGVLGYGSAWPVPHVNTHGIADERAFYFPYTDLWRYWTQPPGEFLSAHPWVKDAREIAARNEGVSMHYNIGFLGYELGTRGIVIDRNGLADPLLARLPCKIPWRIGHYGRVVPAGYPETLQAGTDRFLDPAIGRMWVDLHGIASDPLWSGARWRAIARAHWRGFQPPRTASDYAGEPEPGTK